MDEPATRYNVSADIIEILPENAMYAPLFNMVTNKENWKFPIDATIPAPMGEGDYLVFCTVMRKAIAYFAGGGAEIVKTGDFVGNGWPLVRVTAPGYYALIGA